MRLAVVAFLVLCVVALSVAQPAKNQKQGPACVKDCGDKYEPVCAKSAKTGRERLLTFGTQCVLDNYNCGHVDDPFEVKSQGECGGNVSVRLS